MKSVICTASGLAFDPFDPQPEGVVLEDIAHALAFTPRFGGHCREFYCVAQHSIIVCDLVGESLDDPAMRLAALLHDASEAYVLDMPSPIKRRLPDYQQVEQRVQAVILDRFGVAGAFEAARSRIKAADTEALYWEQRDLMPATDWIDVPPVDRPTLAAWGRVEARDRFFARARELLPQVSQEPPLAHAG